VNTSIVHEKSNMAVYTGHKHLEQVKSIRQINGDVNLNKISPFFTGEKIMYGNSNPYLEKTRINGSDGRQFSP